MTVLGASLLPAVSLRNRFPSPTFLFTAGRSNKATMVSTSTGISYTTLRDRVSCEREIKRSKFIAIAAPISTEQSADSFLTEVRDPRATHNCWAYKIGDQYRYNDDGEPSGTAGKPIYSAIVSSGIDRVMVVVTRYFGGIKLGTGGLTRAYAGVTSDCLKDAPTCLVKSKVPIGMEVPFDLLGSVYHQAVGLAMGEAHINTTWKAKAFLILAPGPSVNAQVKIWCNCLLQSFEVEDIKQDYDTGKDGVTMITFRVDYDMVVSLETKIKDACSRQIIFYKQ